MILQYTIHLSLEHGIEGESFCVVAQDDSFKFGRSESLAELLETGQI